MSAREPAPLARLAPIERTVLASYRLVRGWFWFGPTWAYVCGLAAALPIEDGGATSLARALAGWAIAVPVLGGIRSGSGGAVHDTAVGQATVDLAAGDSSAAAPPAAEPDPRATPRRLTARWRAPGGEASGASGEALPQAVLAVVAVALASLIGSGIAWIVAAAAAVAIGCRALAPRACELPSAARSTLDILVPALVAWCVLGGPVSAPAVEAVDLAPGWLAVDLVRRNGAAVAVFLGFTLVHHGMTSALGRRSLERCWMEIAAGHLVAVAALAASANAVGAGVVAVVFVGEWPFQAALRSGRAVWHARNAQWLAMAAMLAGSIAA